jgi:hypothetical protein
MRCILCMYVFYVVLAPFPWQRVVYMHLGRWQLCFRDCALCIRGLKTKLNALLKRGTEGMRRRYKRDKGNEKGVDGL